MNYSFYQAPMKKPIPAEARTSSSHVVQAAAHCFALAGYHRTQMTDIAERARVALGTLYRHTKSKEDLFVQAMAFGVGSSAHDAALLTPVHDIEGVLAPRLETWFDATRFFSVAQTHAPITILVESLYDTIFDQRLAIRIVDRSAHDLPRLGSAYATRVRQPVTVALIRYLAAMESANLIRPLYDRAASARLLLEVCAWFAMHRAFSPGDADISDDDARRTCLEHMAAAFGQG